MDFLLSHNIYLTKTPPRKLPATGSIGYDEILEIVSMREQIQRCKESLAFST
jgi:hypothetical protein